MLYLTMSYYNNSWMNEAAFTMFNVADVME